MEEISLNFKNKSTSKDETHKVSSAEDILLKLKGNQENLSKEREDWTKIQINSFIEEKSEIRQIGYIDWIRSSLPELPVAKRTRYKQSYSLSDYEIGVLTDCSFVIKGQGLFTYFEKIVESCGDAKSSANWLLNNILSKLKELNLTIHNFFIPPEWIGELIKIINDKTISSSTAKIVFEKMIEEKLRPNEIVAKYNLIVKIDTSQIEKTIDDILAADVKMVEEYKAGKLSLLGHFMGKIMKSLKGADAKTINEILKKKLGA